MAGRAMVRSFSVLNTPCILFLVYYQESGMTNLSTALYQCALVCVSGNLNVHDLILSMKVKKEQVPYEDRRSILRHFDDR